MFFCAYLGYPEYLKPWHETVTRHAAWLGLRSHLAWRHVDDRMAFSFGWLSLDAPDPALVEEAGDRLTLTTFPSDTAQTGPLAPVTGFDTDAIRMEIYLRSGRLQTAMPPITVQPFYRCRDARGFAFGDDLRLLIRWAGLELDERAVYAMFQYDYAAPPLTISKTVRRIPGGCLLTLERGAQEPTLEPTFRSPSTPAVGTLSPSPDERMRQVLDPILARVPQSSVAFFSGGVDSGLLAARLAAIDRTDVTLLNFTVGGDDPDGEWSLRMAAHLGMRCEQLRWQPSDLPSVLERLAMDHSFPLGDRASIPTVLLARLAAERSERPPVAVEGSGPAPTFGFAHQYRTYERLYQIPCGLRRLAGAGYRALRLWETGSRVGRAAAMLRQTAEMPLEHACMSHESLRGFAYVLPQAERESIASAIEEGLRPLWTGASPIDRATLYGLMRTSAGWSAAKCFDPLRRWGIRVVIPYLDPQFLRMSFTLSWDQKVSGREGKIPQKQLMARNVPEEFLSRPKQGFTLPFEELFAAPAIREFVHDVVLSPGNPLLDFCRPDAVRQLVRRAETGRFLGTGARRFLWTFVFTSGWLSGLPAAR